MHILFAPGEIVAREHCFDRVEPLVKHGPRPLVVADRPWEGPGVYWPSFLYDEEEGLFKMWYYVAVGEFGKHRPAGPLIDNAEISGQHFLCYACSRDGLHWEKPALGIVRLKDHPETNILLADSGFFLGCATVIKDLGDPDPSRRYKLLIYDNDGEGRDGARTAVSGDGLHWRFVGDFPILPTQDTPSLWHDRRRGQYVAFLKTRLDGRRARMIATSRDFSTWSEPTVLLAPDSADAPTLHFYGQSAFEHCGQDFGFLCRYEFSTQKLDLELIVGRRGTDWARLPSRPQVLGPGDPGAWDGGMVLPGLGEPIVRGASCWYYYNGSAGRHDDPTGISAIGLATFTYGRLVGQQFEGQGWFETIPFRCPGGALYLDARSRQPLTVEVRGTGYLGVLPGYSRAECLPVEGDRQDHPIRWADHATLDALRGRYIALRVYGANAVVYGARIE